MNHAEYKTLESALASARIEGFQVTEQTKLDCIRLLNGEISVAEIVQEILSRPEMVG